MKIQSITNLSFKSTMRKDETKAQLQVAPGTLGRSTFPEPVRIPITAHKAYNLPVSRTSSAQNTDAEIDVAETEMSTVAPAKNDYAVKISKDTDRNELIIEIEAKDHEAEAEIKYVRTFDRAVSEGEPEEKVLVVPKAEHERFFTFRIPVLNYEHNKYFEDIKITEFNTYNRNLGITNMMSHEAELMESTDNCELPAALKNIEPRKLFNDEQLNSVKIAGKHMLGKYYNVAGGKAEGRIVIVNDEHEYFTEVKNYHGDEPRIVYMSDFSPLYEDLANNTANFYLPRSIKGIVSSAPLNSSKITDVLGHVVSRLRNRQVLTLFENGSGSAKEMGDFFKANENAFTRIESSSRKVDIKNIKKLTPEVHNKISSDDLESGLIRKPISHEEPGFKQENVGLKSFNLGKLTKLSQRDDAPFKVPSFFVVTAGVIDDIKRHPINYRQYGIPAKDAPYKKGQKNCYHSIVTEINKRMKNKNADVLDLLKELQTVINEDMIIPSHIEKQIVDRFEKKMGYKLLDGDNVDAAAKIYKPIEEGVGEYRAKIDDCFIARSAFGGEDSAVIPTQGLYDSIAGIRTKADLIKGVKHVWASKWTDLAYWMRHDYKIKHELIQPNVIIQKVMPVDYTFTLYTSDPEKNDKQKMLVQLSKGVDCGFAGNPYLFTYSRNPEKQSSPRSERVMMATKGRMKDITRVLMDDSKKDTYLHTNYSEDYDVFNRSKNDYNPVIEKIANIAELIEKEVGSGKPQDIEGGVKFVKRGKDYVPEIYIWQTRDIYYPPTAKGQQQSA